MLALYFEGFVLGHFGDKDIAIMVRVLEFGEGIVVGHAFDAGIIDANFFEGLDVIIDDHFFGTDEGHFANFAGFEPATLDGGEAFLAKGEGHIGDVFNAWGDMGIALASHDAGEFPEDVKDDGDIVWGEIPGDIDVFLEEAQVEASGVDTAEFADGAGLDDFGNFSNGGGVEESVTNHEDEAQALGDVDEFFAFGGRSGHGFFDEGMFSREETGFG